VSLKPKTPHDSEIPLLIVDPELDLLLRIKKKALARKSSPVLLSRADQAIHAIDTMKDCLAGALLNPRLDHGQVIPMIIQRALRTNPTLPIFYFCDPDEYHFEDWQLGAMGVSRVILRTKDYGEIRQNTRLELKSSTAATLLAEDMHPVLPLDQEFEADDNQFSPFPIANLASGSLSCFDIYVRLGENRYKSVFQVGDTVAGERLNQYLNAGFTFFFVFKSARERYQQFLALLASGEKKSSSTG
jgi:hypothetical protein